MSKRAEKAAEKRAAYDSVMAAKERLSTDKSLRRSTWDFDRELEQRIREAEAGD